MVKDVGPSVQKRESDSKLKNANFEMRNPNPDVVTILMLCVRTPYVKVRTSLRRGRVTVALLLRAMKDYSYRM
jgi:hypothetical protein